MCLIETGSGCWGLANHELSVRLKAEKAASRAVKAEQKCFLAD
jgi:hypothetical protein